MKEILFDGYSNDNSRFDQQYIVQLKNSLLKRTSKMSKKTREKLISLIQI